MSFLLHIESTSTVCSVAISDNNNLLFIKELNNGYTHAENLHVFISECLKEVDITTKQLNAVSVSSGPGSYTGLRIGFSAAKGLAYALNIPLITVDTLQALTVMALEKIDVNALYCPMLDARRMEVYCAIYNDQLQEILPANALILDAESISQFKKDKPVYFFGDGMPKAKNLLETLPGTHFIDDVNLSAKALVNITYRKFENKEFANIAYAEPFYLKEFFFNSPKK